MEYVVPHYTRMLYILYTIKAKIIRLLTLYYFDRLSTTSDDSSYNLKFLVLLTNPNQIE